MILQACPRCDALELERETLLAELNAMRIEFGRKVPAIRVDKAGQRIAHLLAGHAERLADALARWPHLTVTVIQDGSGPVLEIQGLDRPPHREKHGPKKGRRKPPPKK